MIMGHGFFNAIFSKINNYYAEEGELSTLEREEVVKWDDNVPRLNIFSKETMENHLLKAGFYIEKIYGVPAFVQPQQEDFDPENIKKSRISQALEDGNFFKKVFELEMKYNCKPTVANRGVNIFSVATKK